MKLTKNRTLIAIVCVVIAALLCFGVAPAVTKLFDKSETVLMLNTDVAKGVAITSSMLTEVELTKRDTLNISYVSKASDIVGKYAKSYLYEGVITKDMVTETLDDIDYKLLSLTDGEMAMSITVQSLAGGFSGKLMEGDIIKIVSIDENDTAIVYDELQYVEVLSATNGDGAVVSAENSKTEENLPTTIIIKLTDNAQIIRLMECENGQLHAVFVTRDKTLGQTYLNEQQTILSAMPINKKA